MNDSAWYECTCWFNPSLFQVVAKNLGRKWAILWFLLTLLLRKVALLGTEYDLFLVLFNCPTEFQSRVSRMRRIRRFTWSVDSTMPDTTCRGSGRLPWLAIWQLKPATWHLQELRRGVPIVGVSQLHSSVCLLFDHHHQNSDCIAIHIIQLRIKFLVFKRLWIRAFQVKKSANRGLRC